MKKIEKFVTDNIVYILIGVVILYFVYNQYKSQIKEVVRPTPLKVNPVS